MDSINCRTNSIKNLDSVSSKISTDRPYANQFTKKSNLTLFPALYHIRYKIFVSVWKDVASPTRAIFEFDR